MTTTTEQDFLGNELALLRAEALGMAREIEGDAQRAEALFTVAFLAQASHRGPILAEAIDAADKIADRARRALTLASVLTVHVTKSGDRAWNASTERLLDITMQTLVDLDQIDRIKVLVTVIPALPVTRRLFLIDQAAAEIRAIADPVERVTHFATLVGGASRRQGSR